MCGEEFAPPRPFKPSVALLPWSVVVAHRAHRLVDHRVRLQAIRQHDIGVHSGNVKMVDQWLVRPPWVISHELECGLYLRLDFLVVGDVVQRLVRLIGDVER